MRGVLKLCRVGFISFIVLSVSVTSAMSFDLTNLRNKVSEIKLNPRWNLWASGHFMGKKSVEESSFGKVPAVIRAVTPHTPTKDMQTLLIKILKPQWKPAVNVGRRTSTENVIDYT